MTTTLHLHSALADRKLGVNGTTFFLASPIIVPNPLWELHVSLSHMQIPLSYYAIDTTNDRLTTVYNSGPVAITLPHGNQSIDDVVKAINDQLSDGFVMTYDDNTNKVSFSTDSPAPDNVLSFASDSTALSLIGASTSDVAVAGVLECDATVNLAGPLALFVRSNFSTSLLDPRTRAHSNILAKVPITRQPYEIETFESGAEFAIPDRVVSAVSLYLEDHMGRQVDFHGADYTATITFRMVESVRIPASIDYRLSLYQSDGSAQPIRDEGARGVGGPVGSQPIDNQPRVAP